MICKKCGIQNLNGAKFCKVCGQSLETEENNSGTQGTQSGSGRITDKIKALPLRMILGVCVAVIIAVVTIVAINKGKTIDLNQYITIETTGYDGYGTASVSIDWDAIEKKYASEITFTSAATNEFGGLLKLSDPMDVFKSCISVKLDKSYGLSNGDSIDYEWKISNDLEKYLKCKIKYEDDSYTVNDLTKIGKFDAFADISVEFSGTAPNGRANINYTGSELSNRDIICDKTDGLSNGDKIKVKIDKSNIQYYAEKYGKVPDTFEKEFKVSGLKSYITKISEVEVDGVAFEQMKSQASDVLNAFAAKNWDDAVELKSLTFIGEYLLTSKQNRTSSNNYLYLVYKVKSHINFTNSAGVTYNKIHEYYWYIRFDDLMKEENGNVIVDLTDYETPYDRFEVDSNVSDGWYTKSWYFNGYETLDELYKDVVTSNLDSFNHDDNVMEKEAA